MTTEPITPLTPEAPTPESIRLAHLARESSVKSIGQLCYVVAFFSVLGTIEFGLFALGVIPRDDLKKIVPDSLLDLFFWAFAVVFAINTVAQMVLGSGLIRLRPWARWTVVVLTVMSLLWGSFSSLILCAMPSDSLPLGPLIGVEINNLMVGLISLVVGGAIHGLILWPLVAPGSGMVFSKGYREVIRQTPAIRSRMHWVLKCLLGCLMMLVLAFVGYLLAIYFRYID